MYGLYGNKFYRDRHYETEIKLRFLLKLYNVKRFEGGEYGLTFLFYLHEDICRHRKGDVIIEAFLECQKPDGTSLIPDSDFVSEQRYFYGVEIEDNPDNPMEGTKENPLTYKCTLTLRDFCEPPPEVKKCLKAKCSYTNYFGVCRNHEDELTKEELELVEKLQDKHEQELEEFTEHLDEIEGTYDFIGEKELENDDEKSFWVISEI